jgi:hypothetical protein
VSFLGSNAQPGEQSIVNYETAFEQSMIVIAGQCRQAKRYRVEPRPPGNKCGDCS